MRLYLDSLYTFGLGMRHSRDSKTLQGMPVALAEAMCFLLVHTVASFLTISKLKLSKSQLSHHFEKSGRPQFLT